MVKRKQKNKKKTPMRGSAKPTARGAFRPLGSVAQAFNGLQNQAVRILPNLGVSGAIEQALAISTISEDVTGTVMIVKPSNARLPYIFGLGADENTPPSFIGLGSVPDCEDPDLSGVTATHPLGGKVEVAYAETSQDRGGLVMADVLHVAPPIADWNYASINQLLTGVHAEANHFEANVPQSIFRKENFIDLSSGEAVAGGGLEEVWHRTYDLGGRATSTSGTNYDLDGTTAKWNTDYAILWQSWDDTTANPTGKVHVCPTLIGDIKATLRCEGVLTSLTTSNVTGFVMLTAIIEHDGTPFEVPIASGPINRNLDSSTTGTYSLSGTYDVREAIMSYGRRMLNAGSWDKIQTLARSNAPVQGYRLCVVTDIAEGFGTATGTASPDATAVPWSNSFTLHLTSKSTPDFCRNAPVVMILAPAAEAQTVKVRYKMLTAQLPNATRAMSVIARGLPDMLTHEGTSLLSQMVDRIMAAPGGTKAMVKGAVRLSPKAPAAAFNFGDLLSGAVNTIGSIAKPLIKTGVRELKDAGLTALQAALSAGSDSDLFPFPYELFVEGEGWKVKSSACLRHQEAALSPGTVVPLVSPFVSGAYTYLEGEVKEEKGKKPFWSFVNKVAQAQSVSSSPAVQSDGKAVLVQWMFLEEDAKESKAITIGGAHGTVRHVIMSNGKQVSYRPTPGTLAAVRTASRLVSYRPDAFKRLVDGFHLAVVSVDAPIIGDSHTAGLVNLLAGGDPNCLVSGVSGVKTDEFGVILKDRRGLPLPLLTVGLLGMKKSLSRYFTMKKYVALTRTQIPGIQSVTSWSEFLDAVTVA